MDDNSADRGRILDAALAQFADRGYENTTLEAVGSAAGLDRPNVELLFDSKATLFSALVNRELDRTLRQIIAAVPTDARGSSPGRAVGRALEELHARARATERSWRLILVTDFGSFGDHHARDELRDVLRTRLAWLVSSAVALPAHADRPVSLLLGTMLAAQFEVELSGLLRGDAGGSTVMVESALDRLFAIE